MGHPHRHASAGRPSGDPEMTIDYNSVHVEVTDVQSFARALIAEADHLGDHAGKVQKQLTPGTAGGLHEHSVTPIGADPREHYLHKVANLQETAMTETGALLKSVETGLRNLGLITQRLVDAYGGADGINAAGVDGVRSVIEDAYKGAETNTANALELGGPQK